MKQTHVIIVSLVFVVTAGCTFRSGTTVAEFPSALGPQGVGVRVSVLGTDSVTEYQAELLETRADAFLILTRLKSVRKSGQTLQSNETVVRLVPLSRVERVQSERRSQNGFPKWVAGSRESREQFRLLSRFPQGLTPDLLQQVLKMYGQTEVAGGRP